MSTVRSRYNKYCKTLEVYRSGGNTQLSGTPGETSAKPSTLKGGGERAAREFKFEQERNAS